MKYVLDLSPKSSRGELSLKLEGQFTPKDTPFVTFMQQRGLRQKEVIHIPAKHAYDAFKALAAVGELYVNGKQLLVDLYGKSSVVYRVREGGVVSGEIHYNETVIPLAEIALSDALGAGRPHWYLHGIVIRFIQTEISWSDLYQLAYTPQNITSRHLQEIVNDDDPESPKVMFERNEQLKMETAAKPLPILRLHDRTGAFADLWFDYQLGVDESIVPAHDKGTSGNVKRDLKAEGEWEKDLLETGFQRKLVGRSHYFCPMDKVAKTLSFLLELGWRLQDYQDREVVKQHHGVGLQAEMCGEVIRIKGEVEFGSHKADLKDVYGAFTRRERFVELGKNQVGLLEGAEFAGLEDAVVVDEGLEVRRSSFATLRGLFESKDLVVDAPIQKLKMLLEDLPEEASVMIPIEFRGNLRPYQHQGVEWLQRLSQLGLHGLLADDMGLGKTVQVIAFLSLANTKRPSLIIVPTTLIFNWVKEFERFLPSRRVLIHQGATRIKDPQALSDADIVISTYATVRIDLPLFQQVPWANVILDEAQAIKNNQTQTAQAMCALKADFRLSMTGTPIENSFSELWSHFRFLIPDLFEGLEQFEADAGMDSRRIKKKVQPFMLRRKKSEVALDLPEKIEQVVWVEMGDAQRSLYENFLSQVKGQVNKKSTMEMLEAILRLRQLCCHPLLLSSVLESDAAMESAKFAALFGDLETLFAENQKVLVYSQFTSMLALMIKEARQRGWKFSVLDGSTKDRETQVERFQNDPEISLFFISLKAGGAGLNLTAADAVLIYDPWWNEAVERQAIDRAHRMGRLSPVLAKRYIVRESVEEKMMKIKESKNVLANDILEEELSSLRLTAEDLALLLN